MGTPRKNYYSPYSQYERQYPSQSADFFTQHNGGQQPSFTQGNNTASSSKSTSYFYQSRAAQQQTEGFYEDRQGSITNTPHFYQNKAAYQPHGTPRNFGYRGGRRGQHNRDFNGRNAFSFSQYFHSSMLEDPWRELMERHVAIHGGVLNSSYNREFLSDS